MTVEAVLCSECKFYVGGGCLNRAVTGIGIWIPRKEEDYCSQGKKVEKDE